MNTASPVILVIDDDPVAVELITAALRTKGFDNIETCTDSRNAIALIRSRPIAVVLLDLFMPDVTGFDILEYVMERDPELPVIVLTADDSVDAAVRCMRIGAFDFMIKPIDSNRLSSAVGHALRVRELEDRLSLFTADSTSVSGPRRPELFKAIITRSSRMVAIFQYIEAIAPSPKAVLITGESGTGKELIARALHDVSGRSGPFVPVNVAGLDDVMFSDTLFGHVRGAFTGADRVRTGLVEKAASGTLFLDEIGDLEPGSQIKLLRLLQEGEFYPLGSDEPRQVTLRVVAATNADLAEQQKSGGFRRDLYYRLVSHYIHVPPLRERPEDLPLLIRHFTREAADSLGRDAPEVSPELLTVLEGYEFPGNIRELQAFLADAVSRATGKRFPVSVVREYLDRQNHDVSPPASNGLERISWNGPFPTLAEVEQFFVEEALRRCEQNQSAAARLLGVAQSTLSRRTRKQHRFPTE